MMCQGTRQGPRPLPLHLMMALTCWSGSPGAWMLLKNGWQPNEPSLRRRAEALLSATQEPSAEAQIAALAAEVRRRGSAFLAAIEGYRSHPYRRSLAPPPVVWQAGTTTLKAFAPAPNTQARTKARTKARTAVPLVLVPSLINRASILDLSAELSLARWLAAAGHPVFVVDWDAPGEEEKGFDLSDYIARRLAAAFDWVNSQSDAHPIVIGYCMGGLLALALAQLRQSAVGALVLLATPWDFHADNPGQAAMLAATGRALAPAMAAQGVLPVDVIQSLFAALDPMLAVRKFLAFGALDPDSDAARQFVALEDWLNDGVPLAAPTARACLGGWYGDNQPARGTWQIAGQAIRPADIKLPALCLVPSHDRIVPPASALALGAALANAEVRQPAVGHIGMIASRRAKTQVWQPLADWLALQSKRPRAKPRKSASRKAKA